MREFLYYALMVALLWAAKVWVGFEIAVIIGMALILNDLLVLKRARR